MRWRSEDELSAAKKSRDRLNYSTANYKLKLTAFDGDVLLVGRSVSKLNSVGSAVGFRGDWLGLDVGYIVGELEGSILGLCEGDFDGDFDGLLDGYVRRMMRRETRKVSVCVCF